MTDNNVAEEMLILVDGIDNHNKFYHAVLKPSGEITIHYGRVGSSGAYSNQSGGQVAFDRIIRSKMRKGYERTAVVTNTAAAVTADQNNLKKIARTVLAGEQGNPELDALIDRLVKINRHEIIEASGGLIKIDADSGRISTPLGLISLLSIKDAKKLLTKLGKLKPADTDYLRILESYLKLVPQKVPAKRGWHETFLDGKDAIAKQKELLEQLEDSIKWAEANKDAEDKAANPEDDIATKYEKLFKFKVTVVDSKSDDFAAIVKKYESTKNKNHGWSNLKVKRVFALESNAESQAEYEAIAAEIRNIQQLWHGTKAVNVLSILRRGLFVPPTSGTSIQTVGRMFGDGIYLSNQSSKSLGYAHGYWGGGSRDNNCFMFLADVAMGSEYRPTASGFDRSIPHNARTTLNKFGKPWNSINVKGGTAGVMNHEAIVWNTAQVKLTYLVEFGA